MLFVILLQSKEKEKRWSKLVMMCFDIVFSQLETQVKARLAEVGEDWHIPGYLTRRGRKHGSGLTLCNLYLWKIKQAEGISLTMSKARDKSPFSTLPVLRVAFKRGRGQC